MGLLRIVKPNPVFDHAFGLEPVLKFVQIDGFLLQRPPQAFDEDVDPLPGRVMRSMISRGEITSPSISYRQVILEITERH